MPYVQNFAAPSGLIGQAANIAGSGAQQQMLNSQQIQKNQFAAQQGLQYAQLQQQDRQFNQGQQYQYANLNEQARQYDNSYGQNQQQFGEQVRQADRSFEEQVRQFNENQAFSEQQLAQQNQQFRTQVGQNQFNNLLNAGLSLQQQQNQIAANERMAMFERQARLEQMGYASYLDTASRVYQQQNALSLQQQQQQQQTQAQMQYLDSIKGTLSPEAYSVAKAQIQQRALGIQSKDPALLMSPADREAYYDDLAQLQARQTQRTVQANTGISQQEWLNTYGMAIDGEGKLVKVQKSQAERELELRQADHEYKLQAAKLRDAELKQAEEAAKAEQKRREDERNNILKSQVDWDKEYRSTVKDLLGQVNDNGDGTKTRPYDIDKAEAEARRIMGTRPGAGNAGEYAGNISDSISTFRGVTGSQVTNSNDPFANFVEQGMPLGQMPESQYRVVANGLAKKAPTWSESQKYTNDQLRQMFGWTQRLPQRAAPNPINTEQLNANAQQYVAW